jgi:hypothetical protein
VPKGKGWDLTSRNSCNAGAEWFRKQSGALLVLVVRAEDVAFALDGEIKPEDALGMVEAAMPEIVTAARTERLEARARAKATKAGAM